MKWKKQLHLCLDLIRKWHSALGCAHTYTHCWVDIMWIRRFWYPEKRLNCFQCVLNPGWIMFLVRLFRWSKLMGTLLGFDKVSLSQQTKDFCLSRRAKHLLFYGGCRRWPGKCIAFVSFKHGSSKSSHYKLCWSGKIQWTYLHFVLDRFVYSIFVSPCSFPGTKKNSFVTTVISVSCWEGKKLQIACDRCSFLVAKHFISSHQQLSPIQREEMQLFTANLSF